MNNKNILPIVALIISSLVLLVGNNIYSQATGTSFFALANLKYIGLGVVVVAGLALAGMFFYQRANAFIFETPKNFISGAMNDHGWQHINGFLFWVGNKSKRPISQVSGYLRSNITNQRYRIYLVDHEGHFIPAEETNGIPPQSDHLVLFVAFAFDENGNVNVNGGIDVRTLYATLADSTLVLLLDGKTFQHHISEKELRANIEAAQNRDLTPVPPRITRKDISK